MQRETEPFVNPRYLGDSYRLFFRYPLYRGYIFGVLLLQRTSDTRFKIAKAYSSDLPLTCILLFPSGLHATTLSKIEGLKLIYQPESI